MTLEQARLEKIKSYPTEFLGCTWNGGWEFGRPAVVYYPGQYRRYGEDHVDNIVEDICRDLACGIQTHDGGLEQECAWRGWGRNFHKRKNAQHRKITVKWFIEDGEINFEFVKMEDIK